VSQANPNFDSIVEAALEHKFVEQSRPAGVGMANCGVDEGSIEML